MIMAKQPTVQEMMSTTQRRLGATTGASKGRNAPTKGKIRVKPRKSSIKIQYNKKF